MENDLVEQATALGIKVDSRWSEKTLRGKINALKRTAMSGSDNIPEVAITGSAPEPEKKVEAKMFPVRLLKNYRPQGKHTIVGAAVECGFPGAGQSEKLWAGTVVELPLEEARDLLADYTKDPRTGVITARPVIAVRADAVPV
jgi:hypothetical protein